MVNLSELLSIALNIESEGYAFYSNLASMQADGASKQLFQNLARQEREHQEIFKKLIVDTSHLDFSKDNWVSEEVAGYLKSYANMSIFPTMTKMKQMNSTEALKLAVEVEKDSIIFYSELLPYAGNEKETIKKIISEEKRHLMDLLALLS
ncbi:MAG: ferritin family protein [Pseudothermotoga sp.]|uniref:ferritin family protein n=1 Tax=Pseudothermotoga sp. TaxID=2033661 RepID=UPI00258F67DB|nr:ferritin family protein [Pseudothermotoga sp.]MDI6863634.1 ferritin family protein [Pseudothermotoga sp.]